ncbi:MAG: PEP-CTERM sorting domain-containing protein [Phycisphaerales bacterium JB050]
MRLIHCLAVVAAAGLVVSSASGEIAYNNFGAGNDGFDYNWGLGWSVAGENNSVQFGVEQAFAFTSGMSGELSDIYVPIWYAPITSEPDSVTVHIASYSGATAPTTGDILESWTVDITDDWSGWAPPHQLTSAGGVMLDEGARYWIWMEAANDVTWAGWGMNPDPGYTLEHTLRREGEDWLDISQSTAGALRVDVIPAPGSTALLAIGVGAVARRRRRD